MNMDKNNWIRINGSELRPFDDLLNKAKYFFIPSYQREYVWKKSYINDFLEVIFTIYNNNKFTFNYFGAITYIKRTTKSNEKDYFEIIDGQQRITTFFLFKVALFYIFKIREMEFKRGRKKFLDKGIKDADISEENKFTDDEIKRHKKDNTFTKYLWVNENQPNDKLDLKIYYDEELESINSNGTNQRYQKINQFKTLIRNIKRTAFDFFDFDKMGKSDDRKEMYKIWRNKKNQYIINFRIIVNFLKVKTNKEKYVDSINALEKFKNVIHNQISISEIEIYGDDATNYIVKYFELINTKKEKLTSIDLIKSFMFGDFMNLNYEQKANIKNWWFKIINMLSECKRNYDKNIRLEEYFRYFVLLFYKKQFSKNNFFLPFKSVFSGRNESEKINYALKKHRRIYEIIEMFYNFRDKNLNKSEQYTKENKKTELLLAKILKIIWKTNNKYLIDITLLFLNSFLNKKFEINDLFTYINFSFLFYCKFIFFKSSSGGSKIFSTLISVLNNELNSSINITNNILKKYYENVDFKIKEEDIINKNTKKNPEWLPILQYIYWRKEIDIKDIYNPNYDESNYNLNIIAKYEVDHLVAPNSDLGLSFKNKKLLETIGNKSLLTKRKNIQKSNKNYYNLKTIGEITQYLLFLKYEKVQTEYYFNEGTIILRGKEISEYLYNILKTCIWTPWVNFEK